MNRFDIATILSIWVSIILIVSGCAGVQQSSSEADAFLTRGVTYEKKGQHDRAVADFTEAIEIDPRDAW